MTRSRFLRRVGILCCHFLRNLAFYEAGWKKGELVTNDQFFVNANGNFLDICVLEWCKLFADNREKHHWRKAITDQAAFFAALLPTLKLTEAEFESYIDAMRTYRDKFVAHLDLEETMYPPKLRTARKSVSFLYEYLLAHEEVDGCFHNAPQRASRFYEYFYCLGRKGYPK
ncbi:MAG: hypothetical protein ACYCY1_00515 [Sulfuriferula sp.]